jgi:hypothetical protein
LLGVISVSDILHKGNAVEKPRSLDLEAEIIKARDIARAVCAEKGEILPIVPLLGMLLRNYRQNWHTNALKNQKKPILRNTVKKIPMLLKRVSMTPNLHGFSVFSDTSNFLIRQK